MIVVSGATGHIGSELIKILIEKGEEVTGITSDPKKKDQIEASGAKAVVVDVNDVPAMKNQLKSADNSTG